MGPEKVEEHVNIKALWCNEDYYFEGNAAQGIYGGLVTVIIVAVVVVLVVVAVVVVVVVALLVVLVLVLINNCCYSSFDLFGCLICYFIYK